MDDDIPKMTIRKSGLLIAFILSALFWFFFVWIVFGGNAHASIFMNRMDRATFVVMSVDTHVIDAFSML